MSSKTKTTATKEDGKPALVPKLRFREFRAAEAWVPTTIGALGHFYYGKSAPKWSLAEDAPTPCVRYGELYTKFGPVITETYSRTNTDPETLRFSKGGEILIPRVGEKPEDFGKCCAYLPLKGIAIGEMISVLETKQHPLFYTYYFRNLYKQFAKVVEGQNVKNLYFSELEPIPIHRPSIPEQQKIAECLSSVVELIAAQARKVDALQTHKKGLMQQLLPREGETQPRLRFPEFQNAGDWAEVALGDIADIKLGKMLDKQKHTAGHLLPYLNNLAVRWNEVNTSDLPKMYFNDRELDRFGLRAGDVVVCEGGEPGRAAVWDGRLPDLKFQKAIHRVRFNVPFEPKILVLHLENLAGTTKFEMLFTGGGIKHLTGETFSRLKIPLIPHAEQQCIATCFGSLDALITAETQRLEAIKTDKRGLMQQLFPPPEEVEA